MTKLTFTKESISPAIYYARLEGYPRLFAVITKDNSNKYYSIEIDGVSSVYTERYLKYAKMYVETFTQRVTE